MGELTEAGKKTRRGASSRGTSHELLRAEEALRKSEAQYQALVEHLPLAVYRESLDATEWWTSPQYTQMFGVEPHPHDPYRYTHPDDIDLARSDPVPESDLFEAEYRLVTPAGSFWVHDESRRIRDEQGNPLFWQGFVIDITDRRRMEEELRETAERLEMIIGRAPVAIVTCDGVGRVTSWNLAAEQIFGWTPEEALGCRFAELVGAGDDLACERAPAGSVVDAEARWRKKYGAPVDVSVSSAALTDADGAPRGGVAIIVDMTERRLAEAERHRLSAVVGQSPGCVMVVDLEGSIIYVNPAFERLSGYSSADLTGRNHRVINTGVVGQTELDDVWRRALSGEMWSGIITQSRKDGRTYEFGASISPIRDAGGEIIEVLIGGRDVSREHQLEQQMLQVQKMEAVGRLAGGVAHDFNNLLMAIGGYTDLILAQLPEGDPRREYAAQIQKASEQAGALTQQLLAFSRKQVVAPGVLDLNRVVTDVERMLQRLIGEEIDLVTTLKAQPALVRADRSQVEQVIMNLVVNARDAMPSGGTITIAVSDVTAGDSESPSDLEDVQPGLYATLTVRDTGVGMDAGVRERIFEPFFTTKGPGYGTGLGLSTVYGIVSASGGRIGVETAPGQGSTFTIYLPGVADAGEVSPVAPPVNETAAPRGRETILLVEDETGVRNLVRAVLERYGYTILEARSGPDALRVASQQSAIDLLLTDVVMPRMSGRELAELLTGQRPGLRVLYMSGYTDDEVMKHGVREKEVNFIQKPFRPDIIARRVREILDQRAA
jgi:PAS domain S-box-containing protein